MPEGDTIHYAANRMRPIVVGEVPVLETPHPRTGQDRWAQRLAGKSVTAVDAHGKHLFIGFEGGAVLHSHLRMTGHWGPDILAPELDERRFLRRLRQDDPTRPIGDALLDQRTIAGIGNLWKCEACFEAQVDPWRATGAVADDEALALVRAARPRMQESARDGDQIRHKRVYGRAGRPCPRCGARIRQRGQWDDNRLTYWCAECQR